MWNDPSVIKFLQILVSLTCRRVMSIHTSVLAGTEPLGKDNTWVGPSYIPTYLLEDKKQLKYNSLMLGRVQFQQLENYIYRYW